MYRNVLESMAFWGTRIMHEQNISPPTYVMFWPREKFPQVNLLANNINLAEMN